MNAPFLAVAVSGALVLTTACAAFATKPVDEGVIAGDDHNRGRSLDDQAIESCARAMVGQMFPGTERIRVLANKPGDNEVFGNVTSNALGLQMAVLLEASDVDTGKTLGTAACNVTSDAHVVSLRPGAKDLPPNAALIP
jgi:hypothetical protein